MFENTRINECYLFKAPLAGFFFSQISTFMDDFQATRTPEQQVFSIFPQTFGLLDGNQLLFDLFKEVELFPQKAMDIFLTFRLRKLFQTGSQE